MRFYMFLGLISGLYGRIFDSTEDKHETGCEPLPSTYVQQLKSVFRFTHLGKSWLGNTLNTNQDGYCENIKTVDVSLYDIESQFFKYSVQLAHDIQESIATADKHDSTYNEEEVDIAFGTETLLSSNHENEQLAEQVDGYEGCRRDYSALAEPITNGIIERVSKRVLNIAVENVDSVNEFCQFTCEFICSLGLPILPPERLCENVCNSVCTNLIPSNITKEAAIDKIVDFFIPDIEPQRWGRKMVDAMAKIPTGISDGQLMWTGAWDMCNDMLNVQNNYTWSYINQSIEEFRVFNGQACRIPFQPWLLQNRSFDLYGYMAVCVPDTCTPEYIEKYLYEDNILFRIILGRILRFDMFAEETYCGNDTPYSEDPALITCLTIMFFLLGVVVAAAIYDLYFRAYIMENKINDIQHMKHEVGQESIDGIYYLPPIDFAESDEGLNNIKPSILDRLEVFFVGFSFFSNFKRIFDTTRPPGYVACIDFIRVVTFSWVLMGHTWLFGPVLNELWETANLRSALLHYPRQFGFQAIMNFHFAGDTFFLISGFLVAHQWFNRFGDDKETISVKSVLFFYLHKYWSYIPALMITLMIYTTTYRYIVTGPLTPYGVTDAENCRDLWWKNLLMIPNFDVTLFTTCLSWTWYIPCVFQMHLVSPVILIPLIKRPKFGYLAVSVAFIIQVITASLASAKGAEIYFIDYLVKPWCRITPYLIGILLGMILYKTKFTLQINRLLKLVGWLAAIICLMVPIYSTYGRLQAGAEPWSKADQVAYDTLSRGTWALGVAWLILVCSTTNAGVLGDWINHVMHYPLAKMMYPTFLLHALLCFFQVFADRVVLYITWQKMFQMACSNLLTSFFFGTLIIGMLVHYPIAIGLQRALTVKTARDCIQAGIHNPNFRNVDSDLLQKTAFTKLKE